MNSYERAAVLRLLPAVQQDHKRCRLDHYQAYRKLPGLGKAPEAEGGGQDAI